MSWLSSLFKDKAPEIQTKTVEDPYKTAVSGPLSSFLSSQVGKGLPKFEDAPAVDQNTTNRYNEFLSLNANELFDKYVQGPQTKSFREDLLPIIQEGYAGNLRGSGRFASEEGAINKFEQDLSGLRYTANVEIPKAQIDMAVKYYAMQEQSWQNNYNNWWKSLPENNPVLANAQAFLNGDSGLTLLSQGVPGKNAPIWDLLGIAASAVPRASSTGAKPPAQPVSLAPQGYAASAPRMS